MPIAVSSSSASRTTNGQPHFRSKATPTGSKSVRPSPSHAFHSPSSGVSVSIPHPLNIRPSGNALLSGKPSSRPLTLGNLAVLSDDLINHILTAYDLPPQAIATLSAVSSGLRAFANSDGIWRNLFVDVHNGELKTWHGSWKQTFAAHAREQRDAEVVAVSKLADIRPHNTFYSDTLYLPHRLSLLSLESFVPSKKNPSNAISRVAADLSLEDFHDQYAVPNQPVIFEASLSRPIPGVDTSIAKLEELYGTRTIRAEALRTSVATYAGYSRCCMLQQAAIKDATRSIDDDHDVFKSTIYDPMSVPDESSYYLFDSELPMQMHADGLWTVPMQISQCPSSPYGLADTASSSSSERTPKCRVHADLFCLLASSRPDWRWIIAGPARSGSGWHKDPNMTSAWNTPLSGSKLWLMLPPTVTPPGVYLSEDGADITTPLSLIEWLDDFYVPTKRLHGPTSHGGDGQLLEGICGPGETVYVPSGWWHLVVNLTESVALTQNFVSLAELPIVLDFMKNKWEQISGFKLGSEHSGGNQDEDDFDGASEADPRRKLFETFVERLRLYDGGLAEWALAKLAEREEEDRKAREANGEGSAVGIKKRKRRGDGDDGGESGRQTWWDRLKAGTAPPVSAGDTGEEDGSGPQGSTSAAEGAAGGSTGFSLGLDDLELELEDE